MLAKQIRARFTSFFSKLRKRAALILFTFCAINGLWAIVGTWAISFGGESFVYFDARYQSGIYSNRGYLIISIRDSTFMVTGLRPAPAPAPTAAPFRQSFPWSLTANMFIGPEWRGWQWSNGILDDHPRTIFPGMLINWQDTHVEWHNRGIAMHWALLVGLSSIPLIVSWIRRRARLKPGTCAVCGYDLRATPDRCPECGSAPHAASRHLTDLQAARTPDIARESPGGHTDTNSNEIVESRYSAQTDRLVAPQTRGQMPLPPTTTTKSHSSCPASRIPEYRVRRAELGFDCRLTEPPHRS